MSLVSLESGVVFVVVVFCCGEIYARTVSSN